MNHTKRAPCPQCDRGPRDTALAITTDDRGTVEFCHRCGYTVANNDRDAKRVTALREHKPRQHVGLSDYGRDLWRSTQQISGIARDYLLARAVVIPPEDSDLRWHPALRHPVEHFEGSALVALVRDATTGEPMTLHRTWINANGTKRGNPARMLLGGHKKAGGAIMLWPADAVTHGLAVAEGIESALAAAHVFRPVWSLIDAGNLAAFAPLSGIESLTIFADSDDAGMKAARECARRWRDAGKEIRIRAPKRAGFDVADVARGAA